jgi:hypothetical protein
MSIPSTTVSVMNLVWSGVLTSGGFSCDMQEVRLNTPIINDFKNLFSI